MTALAHAISAALLHFIWQGLAVAFLLRLILAALGRGPAKLRYAVSCAAFAIMSALPFLTTWVVYQAPGAAIAGSGQVLAIPDGTAAPAFSMVPSLSRWIAAFEVWALPVWSAGVAIFAVRLFWSYRHVATLRRESEPAEPGLAGTVARLAGRMNITRPLRVAISSLTDSPSVVGWLRPVILVPAASLLNLSASQLEAVLAHELAHIRRYDYLVNLLQAAGETLFFYQPAIWWVSSRIRNERELCCDDVAIEICGDPVGYARALTQLERLRLATPQLAMGSTAGPLLYRVQRLTGAVERKSPSRLPAAFALCLALIGLTTDLRWAQAQPQSGQDGEVSRDAIWVDSVKYGELPIMVRALGTVTTNTTVELKVVDSQVSLLELGQPAKIEVRKGLIAAGKVTAIQLPSNGTVPVTVGLQASVAEFVNQPVDGIIQVKTLQNVVYVGRPATLHAEPEVTLFKLEGDGNSATRVKVRLGAGSVNSVQVLAGLQPGDRVILSDMSKYDHFDRIRLK